MEEKDRKKERKRERERERERERGAAWNRSHVKGRRPRELSASKGRCLGVSVTFYT